MTYRHNAIKCVGEGPLTSNKKTFNLNTPLFKCLVAPVGIICTMLVNEHNIIINYLKKMFIYVPTKTTYGEI